MFGKPGAVLTLTVAGRIPLWQFEGKGKELSAVRVYFPHFMDVEYSQFFGRQRAARLVDHYLKLLALLGARISIAAAILDGDSVPTSDHRQEIP